MMKIKDNSTKNMIDVFKYQPRSVWVLAGSVEVKKPFEALEPGDMVVVNAGETIPIDGYVTAGIASVDHEMPTKKLAQELGIDHYFAEILPEEKAKLIEQLQQEGKAVCYIGDGINDAIALKKANVSISLRGASMVATDTAQVILMDQSLVQLCYLFDLASEFETNLKTSFMAVLLPSLLTAGGAFVLSFNVFHAMILTQLGVVGGVTTALLPLLLHHPRFNALKNNPLLPE